MERTKQKFRVKMLIWLSIIFLSTGGATYYNVDSVQAESTVYITRTGAKYHTHKCGNGTYYPTTLSDAQSRGLTPCLKCFGGSSYSGSSSNNSSGSSSSSKTKAKAKPVSINKTSLLLLKGQTSNLKIKNAAQTVKWTSTKKSVATVSASGKVVAKKKGKTTVIAQVGSVQKKCTVTVEDPVLNLSEVSLNLSETEILKLKGCKHSVKWTTSDSSVVKVSKGRITAKGVGTARVKASVHGKKFICKVSVKEPDVQE